MRKIFSGAAIVALTASALFVTPTAATAATTKCPKGYVKSSDRLTLVADVKFGISLTKTTDTYTATWCSNAKKKSVKNLQMKHFGVVNWIGAKSTSSKKIQDSTKTIKKSGVVIYSSDIRNIANLGFGFKGFGFQQKQEWVNNYVFGVSPKGYFTYGDGNGKLPAQVGSK